jgi:hypothetical protein
VGGVGVLAAVRNTGSWEDGGGVMDEVVGGAGEVNLYRSGDLACDMLRGPGDADLEPEYILGVAGRESSVVGSRESWDNWEKGA